MLHPPQASNPSRTLQAFEWLDHVNASVLKIQLAMAIIGISSIHLLRTIIEAANIGQPGARYTETAVRWQTLIHLTLIVSGCSRLTGLAEMAC